MCRSGVMRRMSILSVSLAVLLLVFCMKRAAQTDPAHPEYASLLFDDSRVHTIDIQMEDWEGFLEQASRKEYSSLYHRQ